MPEPVPHQSSRTFLNRPVILVAAGFGLGYLARFIFGPPVEETEVLKRRFERPIPVTMPEIDLPLDRSSRAESTVPGEISE